MKLNFLFVVFFHLQILREIFSTPCAEMMGGGGHVEADSPGKYA